MSKAKPNHRKPMSQLMKRAQIFFGEPHPSISVGGRPYIACQAPAQAQAVVLDLYDLLTAVMAAIHATYLGSRCGSFMKVALESSLPQQKVIPAI